MAQVDADNEHLSGSLRNMHLVNSISKADSKSEQQNPSNDQNQNEARKSEGSKILPGLTLKRVTSSSDSAIGITPEDHSWSYCRADEVIDHFSIVIIYLSLSTKYHFLVQFQLRIGPNYSKSHKKAPSAPALFEPFAMDIFRTPKRVDHAARYFELPNDLTSIDTNHPHVPPVFIIQVQIPSEPPTSLFSSASDGPGWILMMFFKITDVSVLGTIS